MVAGEPVLHVSKNWASWLVFYWVSPLMARGSKRQLQASDLFQLPKALLPSTCSNRLWGVWADVRTLRHSVCRGIHAHVETAVEAFVGLPWMVRGCLASLLGQMWQLLERVEQSSTPSLPCTSARVGMVHITTQIALWTIVHEASYPAHFLKINDVCGFQLPAQGIALAYCLMHLFILIPTFWEIQ